MEVLECVDPERVEKEVIDDENSSKDSESQICQKENDDGGDVEIKDNNANEMSENVTDTEQSNEDNAVNLPLEKEITGANDITENDSVTKLSTDVIITPTSEVKSEITIEQNVPRCNNNQTTVEFKNDEQGRSSPEIVVEPKIAERLSSRKIPPQIIRIVTPVNGSVPVGLRLPPKSTEISKERTFFKKFKYFFLLTLFTIIVFGYAVGGAYLFSHLERKRDIEHNAKIDKWKNDTAILLATELRQVKPYEGIWARRVFHYLEVFERDLLKASALGYRRQDNKNRDKTWTWTSSLFFSVSLMTTTGYGSMTPRSNIGRLTAVFYSLLGIPLVFSWFMALGYISATLWISLFQNICCRLCHEKTDKDKSEIFSETNQSKLSKSPKLRSNSIMPIENQKLLPQNKIQYQNSRKCSQKMFPEDQFPRCNRHLTNKVISFQNKVLETKVTEIQYIYYTMDYIVSIIYAFLLFVIYYIFFSIYFSINENLMLTDVLYISFLMFLTLGPGCHELDDEGAEINIKNNVFYIIHLCIGYCILAMIVNLIYMMIRSKSKSDNVQNQIVSDSFCREKF